VPGPPVGGLGVARYLTNAGSAQNVGIEINATYQTSPQLRLSGGYSYHELEFDLDPGATDTAFQNSAGKWPAHMFNTRFAYMLTDALTWNGSAYYTSDLPTINIGDYTKVDTNLSWAAFQQADIIFGIDNLTDSSHQEYSPQLYGEWEEVPRLFYVTLKIAL
jgi:outer membrane receptor protein involved in Fe transport